MARLSDMSLKVQVALVVGLAVAVTVALYFVVYKSIDDENRANKLALEAKLRDNALLQPYEKNMGQLIADIDALKAQLERQKLIVPDEKEADRFMHLMQNTATASGIEIRRYLAKPAAQKEYYTEVPFDMEIDGPYYSVLNFFERVSKLERIINVDNVQMESLRDPGKSMGARKKYEYAPQESVAVSYTAVTFYSSEKPAAVDPKAKGKK